MGQFDDIFGVSEETGNAPIGGFDDIFGVDQEAESSDLSERIDTDSGVINDGNQIDDEKDRSWSPLAASKDVGKLVYDLPTRLKGAAGNLLEESDPLAQKDYKDEWRKADEDRTKQRLAELKAEGGENQSVFPFTNAITRKDIADTNSSMGFSGLAMVPSVAGAGLAATGVGAPLGITLGMAGSGGMAFKMDKTMFTSQLLDKANADMMQAEGREMTSDERKAYLDATESIRNDHALWEAGPEAVGNAIGIFGLGKVFKGVAQKSLKNAVVGFVSNLGGELATETTTQMGQQRAESKLGLTEEAPREFTSPADWQESAKEIFGPTVVQSLLMGGTSAGVGKVYGLAGPKRQQDTTPPPPAPPKLTPGSITEGSVDDAIAKANQYVDEAGDDGWESGSFQPRGPQAPTAEDSALVDKYDELDGYLATAPAYVEQDKAEREAGRREQERAYADVFSGVGIEGSETPAPSRLKEMRQSLLERRKNQRSLEANSVQPVTEENSLLAQGQATEAQRQLETELEYQRLFEQASRIEDNKRKNEEMDRLVSEYQNSGPGWIHYEKIAGADNGFTMRDPEDVYSSYSPELAASLSVAPQLPPPPWMHSRTQPTDIELGEWLKQRRSALEYARIRNKKQSKNTPGKQEPGAVDGNTAKNLQMERDVALYRNEGRGWIHDKGTNGPVPGAQGAVPAADSGGNTQPVDQPASAAQPDQDALYQQAKQYADEIGTTPTAGELSQYLDVDIDTADALQERLRTASPEVSGPLPAQGLEGEVDKTSAGQNKQPWEMTREEYIGDSEKRLGVSRDDGSVLGLDTKKTSYEKQFIKAHQDAIRFALKGNKEIPAHVLEEYPGIAAKYGETSKGLANKIANSEEGKAEKQAVGLAKEDKKKTLETAPSEEKADLPGAETRNDTQDRPRLSEKRTPENPGEMASSGERSESTDNSSESEEYKEKFAKQFEAGARFIKDKIEDENLDSAKEFVDGVNPSGNALVEEWKRGAEAVIRKREQNEQEAFTTFKKRIYSLLEPLLGGIDGAWGDAKKQLDKEKNIWNLDERATAVIFEYRLGDGVYNTLHNYLLDAEDKNSERIKISGLNTSPVTSGERLEKDAPNVNKYGETAKRWKPFETFIFSTPIEGSKGGRILSYDWSWQGGLKFDKYEGGDVETRVSDWDNAVENPETGRQIVHKFNIETPDGESKTVSLESAQKLLGIEGNLLTMVRHERNRRFLQEVARVKGKLFGKFSYTHTDHSVLGGGMQKKKWATHLPGAKETKALSEAITAATKGKLSDIGRSNVVTDREITLLLKKNGEEIERLYNDAVEMVGEAESASEESQRKTTTTDSTKVGRNVIAQSATQEEAESQAQEYTDEQLASVTVSTKVIMEKTGKETTIQERADVALKEIDRDIERYSQLLACLQA